MSDQKLTYSQFHILCHSLGLDGAGNGRRYRNHFSTGSNTIDYPICEELTKMGLMIKRKSPFSEDFIYHVTREGELRVDLERKKEPKLSRSKQRYRDYLAEDTTLTFIEWLKEQPLRKQQGPTP